MLTIICDEYQLAKHALGSKAWLINYPLHEICEFAHELIIILYKSVSCKARFLRGRGPPNIFCCASYVLVATLSLEIM